MFGHLVDFGLRLASIAICHLAHGCRRGAIWLALYSDCLENAIAMASQIGLRPHHPQRGRVLYHFRNFPLQFLCWECSHSLVVIF